MIYIQSQYNDFGISNKGNNRINLLWFAIGTVQQYNTQSLPYTNKYNDKD